MSTATGLSVISVIVPVRNDAAALAPLLMALQKALTATDELIVVDGQSTDESALLARRYADTVLSCSPGRARQMNRGARAARGQWLWFVHADSGLDDRHPARIRGLSKRHQWGRFAVRLSGNRRLFRVIAVMMNLRSRFTGIATGDQGIFVRRELFAQLGGYPDQPLMEDIALSGRLRGHAWPTCLGPPLRTSSRRWEQHGPWRTIFLMWRLRFRYWHGESPDCLHREYHDRN